MSTRVSAKHILRFRLALFLCLILIYFFEGILLNYLIIATGLPVWISEFLLRSASKKEDLQLYIASCAYLAVSSGVVLWYHIAGIFPWFGVVSISPRDISPVFDFAVIMFGTLAIVLGFTAFGIVRVANGARKRAPGHNH